MEGTSSSGKKNQKTYLDFITENQSIKKVSLEKKSVESY